MLAEKSYIYQKKTGINVLREKKLLPKMNLLNETKKFILSFCPVYLFLN